MAKGRTSGAGGDRSGDLENLAQVLGDVDFRIDADDFVLYELGNLIEEDRASFEDEQFRQTVDFGIHAHVEENLELRARLATALRAAGPAALRTIRALEDVEYPLRNVSLIVQVYTAYIFRRLEEVADEAIAPENQARELISQWQGSDISAQTTSEGLLWIGRPAVGPVADLLFDAPEDRKASQLSLHVLGSISSSSSARVLAHAIAEPLLPEDLEIQAYKQTRALWPLPRHYLLFMLSDHSHKDLPFRWFQLLVECDELTAADMVLEEIITHGDDPDYSEDLKAIVELLRLSRDPDLESKIIAVLNSADTPPGGMRILQDFIANFHPSPVLPGNPWHRAAHLVAINRRYIAAAKLVEAGKPDALQALDRILQEEPNYPFADALKTWILSKAT